jgi:hypothetical protein
MATPIGTLGTVPTLTVANRVFTDLGSDFVMLYGAFEGNSTGAHSTPRLANASSGYQVASGKTLTIYAAKLILNSGTDANGLSIAYADNDLGILASNNSPTNPVYLAGFNQTGAATCFITFQYAQLLNEVPLNFAVPATKYPFLYYNGTACQGTYILFGYAD